MSTTYNVYRNGSKIASGLTSTSYVDTGLTDGTLYTYAVSQTVNGIEGVLSAAIGATPVAVGAPGVTPPPSPAPPPNPPPGPPPFPPPPGRPFAPPVTTGTVYVPLSIDHTGATDVSAALNTFIAAQANGLIIAFPPNPAYIYQLSQGIQLGGRNNLVLSGGGVTLKVSAGASGSDQLCSPFVVGHTYGGSWGTNSDIVIHDFVVTGNSPTPGVYIPGTEGQSSLILVGTTRVEVYNITGSAAYGDGIFWEAVTDGWAHNCHFPTSGRNGVSIISGTRIINELSAFDVSGYVTCDFEPDNNTEAITNGYFRNNSAGTWGQEFFALEGSHTGAPINGVFVTGNTISGGSLKAVCDNGNTSRMLNVTFSGNTSTAASVAGPVLTFAHIDGLTVQHNTQGLSSGSLVSDTDCTSAVITPNP
jgi:hypothetical protein